MDENGQLNGFWEYIRVCRYLRWSGGPDPTAFPVNKRAGYPSEYLGGLTKVSFADLIPRP